MATGKKTGGRRRGTPNKITAQMREQAIATGKSMLQIMTENARWADDQVQSLVTALTNASGERAYNLLHQILILRDRSQRYAAQAAPFFHPGLAAIRHDHRSENGELIRPVIEITGYPAAMKEIAPPTPALALAKGKH
jgi:hypothetical protein